MVSALFFSSFGFLFGICLLLASFVQFGELLTYINRVKPAGVQRRAVGRIALHTQPMPMLRTIIPPILIFESGPLTRLVHLHGRFWR